MKCGTLQFVELFGQFAPSSSKEKILQPNVRFFPDIVSQYLANTDHSPAFLGVSHNSPPA